MNSIQKALGLTLMSTLMFSCSNNDDLGSATNPNPQVSAESTHVNFSINVPGLGAANTRAGDSWAGRDDIQTIDLFLVNLSTGKVDHQKILAKNLKIEGNKVSPKSAIQVSSGEEVKAYVLVNSADQLVTELKAKNALELDQAFSSSESTSYLGYNNEKTGYDVVTMTNQSAPQAISIAPSITAEEALKGVNEIKVNVVRVVSRGIVTLADESLKSTVSLEMTEGESVKIQIDSVFYSVGQGNLSYNLMQNATKITPWHGWKPKNFNEWKDSTHYSSMTEVFNVLVADEDINTTLLKEESSAFVLPVTHADGDYLKGNTTYFDIQVKFRPTNLVVGENPDGNLHYGKIDKKFYNNIADAKVENGEYITTYIESIMHYIVWLNPKKNNNDGKTVNSPTYRNTVYRANINSFKKMGYSVNPLDRTNPIDPKNPDNSVDPSEPLEVVNSFLSVDINVVDWGIIDNDVNL